MLRHLRVIGYRPLQARPKLQVATQGGEHLYLQVGDWLWGGGQGGCGHGAVEQGIGRVAAGRVCGLPVGLQVVCEMLAGVLQLVLVQDDVKQLLERRGAEQSRVGKVADGNENKMGFLSRGRSDGKDSQEGTVPACLLPPSARSDVWPGTSPWT